MKRSILKITLSISLLIAVFSCSVRKPVIQSSLNVRHLDDTTLVREGSLIYALPLTVFSVTVELSRTVEKAGPYYKYAGELLGLRDVISRDREYWSVTGIKIDTHEELDPEEFYVIECNNLFLTNALALKKSGLIMDINPAVYENLPPEMSSGLKASGQLKFNNLGADEYFQTLSDTAYRVVKLDTSFVKIPYLVEKKKPLTTDQLAEKAARTILELRDGKHLLLTGEANVLPQSTAAIDEINRMEKEYTSLFSGKTSVEKKTVTLTVVPQKGSAGKPVIMFYFSEAAGLTRESGNQVIPFSFLLEPVMEQHDIRIIPSVVIDDNDDIAVAEYDKLYYRVPEPVSVTVSLGKEKLYQSRKLVYQFGNIIQLPSNYIIGK